MQVPMLDLKAEYQYMKTDIDAAIAKCLEHQHWILGPEVKEFQDKVAAYLGVKNCIGCSSGTEALVLALRALAIKTKGKEYFERKDLIVTTPFTFTATGDAILRAGATPMFVDINPATFNIDIAQLKDCIATEANIVGIIPVHLYGRSCEMDDIMTLAKSKGLFVIEDIAQAFGAHYKGKKLGSIGDAGCFSYFPSKNLGGFGDAGIVSTGDTQLNDLIRMLTKHGGKDKYNVDHIGYNARLDTLQAAVLLAKFKHIDEFNTRRRNIAVRYNEGLKGISSITTPEIIDGHVVHQYTIRLSSSNATQTMSSPSAFVGDPNTSQRDHLQNHLKNAGIQTMVYYPYPLHTMKVFKDNPARLFGPMPNAESAAAQVLSLPIEPLQSNEATDYIIKILSNI